MGQSPKGNSYNKIKKGTPEIPMFLLFRSLFLILCIKSFLTNMSSYIKFSIPEFIAISDNMEESPIFSPSRK